MSHIIFTLNYIGATTMFNVLLVIADTSLSTLLFEFEKKSFLAVIPDPKI